MRLITRLIASPGSWDLSPCPYLTYHISRVGVCWTFSQDFTSTLPFDYWLAILLLATDNITWWLKFKVMDSMDNAKIDLWACNLMVKIRLNRGIKVWFSWISSKDTIFWDLTFSFFIGGFQKSQYLNEVSYNGKI